MMHSRSRGSRWRAASLVPTLLGLAWPVAATSAAERVLPWLEAGLLAAGAAVVGGLVTLLLFQYLGQRRERARGTPDSVRLEGTPVEPVPGEPGHEGAAGAAPGQRPPTDAGDTSDPLDSLDSLDPLDPLDPAEDGDPEDDDPFSSFRRLVESLDLAKDSRERSYMEIISAMVATAHARDHETIGHSFRVARYAVTLGRAMGLDETQVTAIEWGALLHDVGKITVPENVLRKRGPLSPSEQAVMQEHPRRGYQMLRSLLFLGAGLDVVLSHHERWDGRGYPNGLVGEEIPLAARIFAVVDTYDAITSHRPYREARPHAAAVEELRRVSGHQLDPRVVARFLELSPERLEVLSDLSRPVDDEHDSACFRVVVEEGEPRSAYGT